MEDKIITLNKLTTAFEILEKLTSNLSMPFKYSQVGLGIRARILYLQNNNPNSELINKYEKLYAEWEKNYNSIINPK